MLHGRARLANARADGLQLRLQQRQGVREGAGIGADALCIRQILHLSAALHLQQRDTCACAPAERSRQTCHSMLAGKALW